MRCIQVILILFINFCSCACFYISLCIVVILSLFMNLCFSCIFSWIISIEFVISFNIHHVFGMSLEQYSFFTDNRIYYFVCSYIRGMKIQMEKEDTSRHMSKVVRTSIGTVT